MVAERKNIEFGNRLRFLLKKNNMSQKELTLKLIKLNPDENNESKDVVNGSRAPRSSTVANWVAGYSLPNTKKMNQLSEIFDVSISYLYTGVVDVSNETKEIDLFDLLNSKQNVSFKSEKLSETEKDRLLRVIDVLQDK